MPKAMARCFGHRVKFDVESASGHTVDVDEAPVFGDDAAMRPTEMFLAALDHLLVTDCNLGRC